MKNSYARLDIVVFVAILLCSATTMLWLFWRFPIYTGIATIAILAGLSLSTRLAAASDGESFVDLSAHEQGAQSH
jgi:hypothetical protein